MRLDCRQEAPAGHGRSDHATRAGQARAAEGNEPGRDRSRQLKRLIGNATRGFADPVIHPIREATSVLQRAPRPYTLPPPIQNSTSKPGISMPETQPKKIVLA